MPKTTNTTLKHKIRLNKGNRYIKNVLASLVVVSVAVLGIYTIRFSSAATPTVASEAESGTRSGNVSLGSDSNASNGSYVKFGSTAPVNTAKLTWSPPAGYQSYPVKNVSVSSTTQTVSGSGGDMWVKLPSSATGPINLTNCRNVVIIGGQINLPPGTGPSVPDIRGIYINGCTGTVYIEGVYINGDVATAEGDGIAIQAPSATVIVQNVRIEKLYGAYDTTQHNHSDIIQPWGGVKTLLVDHLTGSSNYQGFQINVDAGPIETETFKNVNIGDSGVAPLESKGGYYLWLSCGSGTTYTFTNTYLKPRAAYPSLGLSARTLSNSITEGGCGMSVANNVASFSHADFNGVINGGVPPAGDFVPMGVAGLNYVSPGYQ